MHAQNFAAIWEWPPDWPTPGEHHTVCYLPHMRAVESKDLIFMFRAGQGLLVWDRRPGESRGQSCRKTSTGFVARMGCC